MSRGLSKRFDVYDRNGKLIFSRAKVMRVSKFLRVEYTRLYDIANLNRKVKGYKVSYSKRKVPETFFCQNCRKFNKTGGVFHKDKKRGKLRLCDEVCKSEIINKLKGFDNEQ